MKYRMLFAALAAAGLLGTAGPARAQFFPGYGGYGGWGGTDGSAALLGTNYVQASVIQAKNQSMIAGQQLAAQQNMVVQSGIRNTLSSQAQAQANAIQSQQQANQDWWFQQQVAQTNQRRAREAATGAMPLPVGLAPAGGPPPANMDIIKWPTVLQEACFASERTAIETPYRRTTGKLSPPMPADYRKMAAAVEDMKAILEWRLTQGVDTGEYNTAKAFLAKLGDEIGRAEATAQ